MNYKQSAKNRIIRARNNRIKRFADKYSNRIRELKDILKKEPIFIKKCKEYNESPDFIDNIEVSFSPDLDVSAKTVNEEIFLNEKLIEQDIHKQVMYLCHEATHCLQQAAGKVEGKVDKADYLDDENEQEAFSTQISYMCENEDAEEVQQYIENLLDHHGIEGEERKEKAKKLVEDL